MESPAEPQLTPAQEKAKRQRERRLAKIQAGGSARLSKITALSGRPAAAAASGDTDSKDSQHGARTSAYLDSPTPSPVPSSEARATPLDLSDPEEVDISDRNSFPASRNSRTDLTDLFPLPPTSNHTSRQPSHSQPFPGAIPRAPLPEDGAGMRPFAGVGGTGDPQTDPMVQLMQQMLAGGGPNGPNGGSGPSPFDAFGGGGGGGVGGMGGLPEQLAQLLGNAQGAASDAQQQQPQASAPRSTQIWRLVHFLFAATLAAYVGFYSRFDGSAAARSRSKILAFEDEKGAEEDHGPGRRLFYMFATAELILQSTRFFVERGQLAPTGMLGTAARMLPEPFAGYVRIAGRYIVIGSTVLTDALVVVFVLGVMAWWKGEVES